MMWCKWQTAWRWLLSRRRRRPGSNELATLLFNIATDFIKVNAGWEARRMGRHYSMQISRTYPSLLCFRVQNLLCRLWMPRRRLYSCSLWSGRAGVCPLLSGELASRSTWFIRSALYVDDTPIYQNWRHTLMGPWSKRGHIDTRSLIVWHSLHTRRSRKCSFRIPQQPWITCTCCAILPRVSFLFLWCRMGVQT